MLLGPGSGMDSYAGHPLVGTLGLPLVVYPGLKVCSAVSIGCHRETDAQLNFLRPRFLRVIKEFVSPPTLWHRLDAALTVATRRGTLRRPHLAWRTDPDGDGAGMGGRVSGFPTGGR
jgi:hypothetical protein